MEDGTEICGNVCARGICNKFILKCFFCKFDIEIAKWQQFVIHFSDCHNFSKSNLENDKLQRETNIENIEFIKNENGIELEHPSSTLKKDYIHNSDLDHFHLEEELVDFMPIGSTGNEQSDDDNDSMILDSLESDDDEHDAMPFDSKDIENSDKELTVSMKEDCNLDDGYADQTTVKFKPSFYKRDSRTSTFIKIYKSNSCLWDSNDVNYRNKDKQIKAYQSIIQEMSVKEKIILNERTLKFAIRRLHEQYEITKRKLRKGNQRTPIVLLSHYKRCRFLDDTVDPFTKDMDEPENEEVALKIKLDFSSKNDLTINLIQLYSGLPLLYDPNHEKFNKTALRKEAYETIAAEFKTSEEKDIGCCDIIEAIQNLRRWYYKTKKYIDENNLRTGGGAVSKTELFYVNKCKFLLPNAFTQRLSCELCEKCFFSDFPLQAHFYTAHGVGELPYKCLLCDRCFKGRTELIIHKQRIHIGKVHKCTSCDRSFAVLGDLKMHLQTHTGIKPYICESCGKAFRKKTQLNEHTKRMHTKIRAFKCDICPKDFLKKCDLRDHVKSHLNVRDKICETCGKGFTNCHSLIRHRQIHSEIKKFACKLCDSRFSQFVGLNSHMKRTHNIVRVIPKEADVISC